MDSSTVRHVHCPVCQQQVPWTVDSHYRPFCNERCRLIDLNGWFNGKYQIPDQTDATQALIQSQLV